MRPVKILVVEDDVFIGKRLVKKLEKEGYLVTDFVTNRQEAIQSFKKEIPDIIIVDIELEEKGTNEKDTYGGIELVNTITSNYNTPCIYYTGHGNDEERISKAQATNHTGIVIKTAPFLQVKIAIQSVLQRFWEVEKKKELPPYFFIENWMTIRGTKRKVLHRVEAKNIVWVAYADNGVQIFAEGNKNILHKKHLQLSTFLKEHPYPFLLQISQSKAVNQEKIVSVLTDTDEILLLHNDTQHFLSITKTYRKPFMQFINNRKIKSQ